MIEIEKNVPMPSSRRYTKHSYPFEKMGVGDSFAVPVPEGVQATQFAANIRTTAHVWGKARGVKFSVLLVDGLTRVRVWRIA